MYIRDVQKRKKEEEKEAEETKKILQQIDKAAYKQYSQDCLTNENLSKKDLKVNFSYYSTNEKDINAELAKKKSEEEEKTKKEKDKPVIDKNTGIGQWEVVEPEESVEDPPAITFKTDSRQEDEDKNVFHAKESSYNSSIQVIYDEEKDIDNLNNFKIEEKKLVIESTDDDDGNKDKPVLFKKRKAGRKDKKKNTRIKLD
jgi:hypothetical protein